MIHHLARSYPSDHTKGKELGLRTSIDKVSVALETEIQERESPVEVQMNEARFNHLAYAAKIANEML